MLKLHFKQVKKTSSSFISLWEQHRPGPFLAKASSHTYEFDFQEFTTYKNKTYHIDRKEQIGAWEVRQTDQPSIRPTHTGMRAQREDSLQII